MPTPPPGAYLLRDELVLLGVGMASFVMGIGARLDDPVTSGILPLVAVAFLAVFLFLRFRPLNAEAPADVIRRQSLLVLIPVTLVALMAAVALGVATLDPAHWLLLTLGWLLWLICVVGIIVSLVRRGRLGART